MRNEETKHINSAVDGRPPTRQKSPRENTGLELPPKPMTPPETEDLFEMTWSHSIASELQEVPISNRRKQRRSEKTVADARPITVNAWGDGPKKVPFAKSRPLSSSKNPKLESLNVKRASTGRM